MLRALSLGSLMLFSLSFTTGAHAQAAETAPDPPSAPSAPSAPDIVRLKTGGLIRGTISELVPGDYVMVVTVAGHTRTLAMADVEYAGPTSP